MTVNLGVGMYTSHPPVHTKGLVPSVFQPRYSMFLSDLSLSESGHSLFDTKSEPGYSKVDI